MPAYKGSKTLGSTRSTIYSGTDTPDTAYDRTIETDEDGTQRAIFTLKPEFEKSSAETVKRLKPGFEKKSRRSMLANAIDALQSQSKGK